MDLDEFLTVGEPAASSAQACLDFLPPFWRCGMDIKAVLHTWAPVTCSTGVQQYTDKCIIQSKFTVRVAVTLIKAR